jgi:hypothetical protein
MSTLRVLTAWMLEALREEEETDRLECDDDWLLTEDLDEELPEEEAPLLCIELTLELEFERELMLEARLERDED